jgi:hypothetical protein
MPLDRLARIRRACHIGRARGEAVRAHSRCVQFGAMRDQLDDLLRWLKSQRELCDDIDYHRRRGEPSDYRTPRLFLCCGEPTPVAAGVAAPCILHAGHAGDHDTGRCRERAQ